MGERSSVAAIVMVAWSLHAWGAEHIVSSAAEITQVAPTLAPGDVVVLRDGQWVDQTIVLGGKGTKERPVTYRARTAGKVVLTGDSSVVVEGEHVIVSGLFLKDSKATRDGILVRASFCRVTQCAVVGGAHKFFVHLFGYGNRMDRCYLANKTNDSPTMQVEVEAAAQGGPNGHVIEWNHFGHRPPLGRNGGETIRVGYSHQSMSDSGTTVQNNLFERCDGELEVISNKSCANVYRGNTFRDCAGMFTLRHGNRCLVEGNFFLGGGVRGSGGIRVIGEGHAIVNNYIERVAQGGIWVTSGIVDSELRGYFQAKDCLIAFNTIVESKGPCIQLDAGIGSSRRTLRPANITVANNVLIPGEGGTLFKGTEGDGWNWIGNVGPGERAGVRNVEPKLVRGTDGLLRPVVGSPLIGSAEGAFELVKVDVDGQERGGKRDVGCDQVSDGPVRNRPLGAEDVGPGWIGVGERR